MANKKKKKKGKPGGPKGRADQRRGAFARRQRRRETLTKVVIGAIVVVVSLGMVLTLMPGDLSAIFGGGAQQAPEVEEPPPLDEPEVGGVACDGEVPDDAEEDKPQWDEPPERIIDPAEDYEVVIATSCGEITLHLFAADAPDAANNLVFLAEEGFYDGVVFHRVIPGFMIQGGDPTGTGMGGPGYRFEDELELAEEHGYPRGTLAMANAGPDTNGSQFFIVHRDAPHLPPDYTVFGEVVDGLDVVDTIAAIRTDQQDRPTQTVYIESVTVSGPIVDAPDDETDDDHDDGETDETTDDDGG